MAKQKSASVPPEYVGQKNFDPQEWIDRLIEVNSASQFPIPQRMMIHDTLLVLKKDLRDGRG